MVRSRFDFIALCALVVVYLWFLGSVLIYDLERLGR